MRQPVAPTVVAAALAAASLAMWRLPLVLAGIWVLAAFLIRRRHRLDPVLFPVVFLSALALLGSWLAPYDPGHQFTEVAGHPLGLDRAGRDLFSRLLIGNRNSVFIAGAGSLAACLAGLALGMLLALGPGWLRWVVNRLIQAYMIVPVLVYFLLGLTLFAPGAATLVCLLAVVMGPDLARIVQVRITELRGAPFVQVARMAGLSGAALVWREILPNLLRLVAVNFLICFGSAIVIESVLGYLGLGLGVGTPSLGHLVEYGVRNMDRQPLVLTAALLLLAGWTGCLRLFCRRMGAPDRPPVTALG